MYMDGREMGLVSLRETGINLVGGGKWGHAFRS